MERTEVESSSIAAIGYDMGRRVLEIEFVHGGVYQYSGVPASVYTAMMHSPSKGQFFHRSVRGFYSFTRME